MSGPVHLLDLPIKNEPMDDDGFSVSTGNDEEDQMSLSFVVLKEIKPYVKELAQRLSKIEKESLVNAKKADKAIAAIQFIVADFDSLKLRLSVLEAANRTPWNRKDDNGQAAQPSSTNNEVQTKLEQYEGFFRQIAAALNKHGEKIQATEQVMARIVPILQPTKDESLGDIVKDLDNKEQVASERITMLEERSTHFEEQISEVSSLLGNEPMLPGEGEPTDLITRRVASLEQQSSKCITTMTKTSELVSKLSLAQTINGSTAIDPTINTDVAAAFNARIDDLILRVDKLERAKAISDTTPFRSTRQNVRGGSGAGRKGFNARGGHNSRSKTQDRRNDWVAYPKGPKVDDSRLIDDTKGSDIDQPRPASFQVDDVQLSQEEQKKRSIFHKQMNEVSRMYQKAELVQKKKEIDQAMSRTPPFYEVHELSYEQLEKLMENVKKGLSKFSPIMPEPMAGNDATSGWI
ncbi:hypothetical protein MBLNU457_1216t1 [Dothideomycetes sp. NU457]